MVAERRAGGAALTQIGRELKMQPDQLRAWIRAQREAHGAGTGPTGETPEQELRCLRREVTTLRQEQAFAKSGGVLRARVALRCELSRLPWTRYEATACSYSTGY